MKNVYLKTALMGLLFFGCYLFVNTGDIQAQSTTTTSSIHQQQYVDPATAQEILEGKMVLHKESLETLEPGSAAYTQALREYYFFGEIDGALKAGAGVANAIDTAKKEIRNDKYELNLTSGQIQVLVQSAIDLLRV